MQGYCVCSSNIAVMTMIQHCRGYGCSCASLCEKAPRRTSFHIPDNSHCPAGAVSSITVQVQPGSLFQKSISATPLIHTTTM